MNSRLLRLSCGLIVCAALRPGVCALAQGDLPAQPETSNLAVDQVRRAIISEHASIASHPKDPASYIDFAYTLTDAGSVDHAILEAKKATEVDSHSAFAYSAQGWVLQHNAIGVEFGKGMKYDAAIASYRRSIELDPKDLSVRGNLADLLERDPNGVHYAPGAHLDEAIEILRYVKGHQLQPEAHADDNLAIDLFYAGRYAEVLPELANVSPSPLRNGVAMSALAALNGPDAAIAFANQIGGDEQNRKDALNLAAEGLWNMRLYPQAAALLTASLPDTSESKGLIARIQVFRNLKPYKGPALPATDPRSPVERLFFTTMTGTATQESTQQNVSIHAFSGGPDAGNIAQLTNLIAAVMGTLTRQTGLPRVVIQDILMGAMKLSIAPSTEPGSRIVLQFLGSTSRNFFVLKDDDGAYKIAGIEGQLDAAGTEALYLLKRNREPEAEALLNWSRDLDRSERSDDPLGGPLFLRLWNNEQGSGNGQNKGPQAIQLAAASLLTHKPTLTELLPVVVSARSAATTDAERDNLDLLLASIYIQVDDAANAKLISQQLLLRHPGSTAAISLAGRAYGLSKDWASWKSLVDAALAKRPNDRNLLLQSAAEATAAGDLSRARRARRVILDSGHAVAEDYNMYAWLSLFEDHVDDQALEAAQQAVLLSKNSNYAFLHTLACLNAARGATAEARQLLLESMTAHNLEEPDSSIWYGFGRIFEQYGEIDAATSAYKRVTKPVGAIDPTGVYVLAQSRLKTLHAN
jgi:tetratricopeptide (TPR) repeat protein